MKIYSTKTHNQIIYISNIRMYFVHNNEHNVAAHLFQNNLAFTLDMFNEEQQQLINYANNI